MNKSDFFKLVLFRFDGIGPAKYKSLLKKFDSAEDVVHYLNIPTEFIDKIKYEIDAAEKKRIEFIFEDNEYYPNFLKNLNNNPPILTALGNIKTLQKLTIGIVGTRHASLNGINFVKNLATDLANNKFCIVSGMAIGIDSAAHSGALNSNENNSTIAVLAGGVDKCWPLENEKLYNQIIEHGCVISDMPIGTNPIKQYFVKRNYLIAGISEKLILAEANLGSGSIITANHAFKLNRKIYAIPGHPTDPRSMGPNQFIYENKAQLCYSIENIIETKSFNRKQTMKYFQNSKILEVMNSNIMTENEIATACNKSITEIKSELVLLELEGKVKKTDGGYILLI